MHLKSINELIDFRCIFVISMIEMTKWVEFVF